MANSMIVTFILQLAYGFFSGIQSLFSGVSVLSPAIISAITSILDGVNNFSYLIPVSSLFAALGIVVVFEFVLWSFRGFVWIYRHIPFIGH